MWPSDTERRSPAGRAGLRFVFCRGSARVRGRLGKSVPAERRFVGQVVHDPAGSGSGREGEEDPARAPDARAGRLLLRRDRKSTRLNSSHLVISYAVFCLKKKIDKERLSRHLFTPSCRGGDALGKSCSVFGVVDAAS